MHYRREHRETHSYLSVPPLDSDGPPSWKRLREVIDYCSRNIMQFITECDDTAHITQGIMLIHEGNA